MTAIRVELPAPLRRLVGISAEVWVVPAEASIAGVLDALETLYPALQGTIRDQVTGVRRPFLRFFAQEEDLSAEPMAAALPEAVSAGREPLLIIGAIAGG